MRITLLAPLAAAALPVTAWAVTEEEIAREARELVVQRPGQYRTTLEMLHFESPDASKQATAQMGRVFAKGLEDNLYCLTPEAVADRSARGILEGLTEGDCSVEAFDVEGETVTAALQCRYNADMFSHVTLNGRIGPESSELVMSMEQKLGSTGPIRIKLRISSQRIGECA
jgi:hypothetical protein